MFASPPEQTMEWSDAGVEGAYRFLKRLWNFAQERADALARSPAPVDWARASNELRAARRELHLQLKQADFDYQRLQYNTVVSAGMKMLNTLEAAPADANIASIEFAREGFIAAAPTQPRRAASPRPVGGACYAARLGDLIDAPWPKSCGRARSGRDRARVAGQRQAARQLTVDAGADKSAIEAAALASAPVQKAMAENGGIGTQHPPARIIIVPNRLVNVVLPTKTVPA